MPSRQSFINLSIKRLAQSEITRWKLSAFLVLSGMQFTSLSFWLTVLGCAENQCSNVRCSFSLFVKILCLFSHQCGVLLHLSAFLTVGDGEEARGGRLHRACWQSEEDENGDLTELVAVLQTVSNRQASHLLRSLSVCGNGPSLSDPVSVSLSAPCLLFTPGRRRSSPHCLLLTYSIFHPFLISPQSSISVLFIFSHPLTITLRRSSDVTLSLSVPICHRAVFLFSPLSFRAFICVTSEGIKTQARHLWLAKEDNTLSVGRRSWVDVMKWHENCDIRYAQEDF